MTHDYSLKNFTEGTGCSNVIKFKGQVSFAKTIVHTD